MLQSIRDRLTGILAIVILGILVIPFAFVGVNSYFSSGTGNLVALVNDQEITFNEFNQSFLDYRRRLQAQMGDAFDASRFDGEVARREHLDQMIDETLLRQVAADLNLSVDDERLAQQIRDIPAFQVDGQFNADVYQSRLIAFGQSPTQFEAQLRNDLAVSQLPSGIQASSFATNREVRKYVALSEQQRSFATIMVPADMDAVSTEFSDEDIEAWYADNSEQFRTPEQVVIEYLELDASSVAAGEPPNDDVLRDQFEAQKNRFMTPEQRRVSHILVEVAPDAGDAAVETARERAEDIASRARDGEDFAALAEETSDDIGSASLGGDLGFIEPGVMVEAFENAVYEISTENPVSDPVQTGFGWHIIKLTEVREAEGQSFEEARETLLAEYREDEVDRAFLGLADRLVDVIYEDPTTLEAAALDLGLEVQTVGPFGRMGGEGIAANPDVVEAAFSDLVLLQGSVSDPIDLDDHHLVMVRLAEHLPAAIPPLEDVREGVIAGLRAERARDEAEARANALLASLEDGASLEDLAAGAGLELEQVDSAARRQATPDRALVGNVFRLKRPAEGETVDAVVETGTGYALVSLQSVVDGVVDEDSPLATRQARMMVGNAAASFDAWALVRQLREQADIEIFEDNLSSGG
ncbi:hypothetical protein F3N42_01350 [Marinihelvus fidelis]|uniref:Periplasmic chaperone PpiD n=1 Tax=Marinihelvus fidelis TaxID=2613842 RepID=A0A5N0TD80_9GAMM|nr:SurA N-terminal domain-containing protein [Marinihelvus fidelis]KAA9133043.1 hypothetical protein F3N42_01350 [Marinihelvus fidelis]